MRIVGTGWGEPSLRYALVTVGATYGCYRIGAFLLDGRKANSLTSREAPLGADRG